MKAMLYKQMSNKKVQCLLCNHKCIIKDGEKGICKVRQNIDGQLETIVYGRLIAQSIDPIEKKPLFHVAPGSLSFSIATIGCNFRCKFCQNAHIAQVLVERPDLDIESISNGGVLATPESVVNSALSRGCKSIAYTYNEPTVFFEFAYDVAKFAHDKGILNVFVTNGYMTKEAVKEISPFLDAANVDLKAFNDDFYKKFCKARVEPVKETLKEMKKNNIFVEITTLLIPGLNDDESELKELAFFIVNELGKETPWHISKFHPSYKLLDVSSTPANTIAKAREIGLKAGLKYVYTGNLHGDIGENTFCPNCGKIVIQRTGFYVKQNLIKDHKCSFCNAEIHGVEI